MSDFRFPEYPSVKPAEVRNNNNGGYQYYIKRTNRAEYHKYLSILDENGFRLYSKNESAGNMYATYINDEILLHVYFVSYTMVARIIVEPLTYLPPLEPEPVAERIAEPSVTQLALDYEHKAYGMGFIITLEDGRFIVIDGGLSMEAVIPGKKNTQILYDSLVGLNRRKDKKIVIAAWLITHAHCDHYQNFMMFAKEHGSEVTLETLIINTPSPEGLTSFESFDPFNSTGEDAEKYAAMFDGKVNIYKPHTGQVSYIGNVKFEILYTQEDFYPKVLEELNDSSIVSRMTVGGQTLLFLGDIYAPAADVVASMYGPYLKSDIVQLAHHGYFNGGSQVLYMFIDAKLAFWPQSADIMKLCWVSTDTVVEWLKNAGNPDIIVADPETRTVTLPYGKD